MELNFFGVKLRKRRQAKHEIQRGKSCANRSRSCLGLKGAKTKHVNNQVLVSQLSTVSHTIRFIDGRIEKRLRVSEEVLSSKI